MQVCCNRIKVIWNLDHDAWCTKKLFLLLQEYTFMRQNILWLYDTKLEIPFSSGSVLETDPTSWPLTQGKVSLSNDKLFTSVKKQKYHAKGSRRAVTFISTLGYSGLKNQIHFALYYRGVTSRVVIYKIFACTYSILCSVILLCLYNALWSNYPDTLHYSYYFQLKFHAITFGLQISCYIKIYIYEDIHV